MGKLAIKFEIILPQERNYPANRFRLWDQATEAYMRGPLRSMLISDFNATTERWDHKPSFRGEYTTPYTIRKQVSVFPVGRYSLNWARISEGTATRSIVPRRAPMLVFPRYYTPHTSPYRTGSYGGPGLRHGPTVRTLKVRAHSIAPRKFTRTIAKQREKEILLELKAITEAVFR